MKTEAVLAVVGTMAVTAVAIKVARRIGQDYVDQTFKSGKIIQNAENLTIVGSPYAMLLYAATGDENSVDKDDTFFIENGMRILLDQMGILNNSLVPKRSEHA